MGACVCVCVGYRELELTVWRRAEATTNLNNQPVGINWLDAGAQEPLQAYLNGSTDSVVIPQTTNE